MPGRPYVLAETTWKTVQNTDYQVAILPWGATEAHNYHLPYGTDTIQSDYIAAESARRAWEQGARVVALPTVPFGVNTGQLDVTLDINMMPSTQAAVLRDVADALSRQGIPKLVVLNGHGGNNFKQMIREVGVLCPDVFVCTLSWFQIIDEELGDIDHLLLGKCWVKQISDLEYWIRTESLGWIYLRKDWSPWFWRMDNGHWYWLDHDSWPGRAWDYEDQEWEELY